MRGTPIDADRIPDTFPNRVHRRFQIFFETVSREFLLAAPADIVAVLPTLFVARVRFEARFVALFCPFNARATVGITGAKSRWIT